MQELSEDMSPPSRCDLAALGLKHDYFSLDGEYYVQAKGMNMGSNFAPSYAILYFEQCFVYNEQRNPFYHKIIKWHRYLEITFSPLWTGERI